MKRILKVLVVSALMVVLMATTVSPALAQPPKYAGEYGYGTKEQDDWKDQEGAKGFGADGENEGYKTGHRDDKWGYGA